MIVVEVFHHLKSARGHCPRRPSPRVRRRPWHERCRCRWGNPEMVLAPSGPGGPRKFARFMQIIKKQSGIYNQSLARVDVVYTKILGDFAIPMWHSRIEQRLHNDMTGCSGIYNQLCDTWVCLRMGYSCKLWLHESTLTGTFVINMLFLLAISQVRKYIPRPMCNHFPIGKIRM